MSPTAAPLEARFDKHLTPGDPDACWPWAGPLDRKGYGVIFHVGGQTGPNWSAHRAAWTLLVGPIPAGMHVLHTCDNPPCCNPAHLFLGTNDDNVADMVAKGRQRSGNTRTHCKRGHEFTPANTFTAKSGKRQCRACQRFRKRRARFSDTPIYSPQDPDQES